MINCAEIERIKASLSPEALLLEPRSVFDCCLIGFTSNPQDHWERKSSIIVAVYSFDLIMEILVKDSNWEQASDHFFFNTAGAYLGAGTPTFKYE